MSPALRHDSSVHSSSERMNGAKGFHFVTAGTGRPRCRAGDFTGCEQACRCSVVWPRLSGMSPQESLDPQRALTDLYAAFNRRDMPALLAALAVDVVWPNGWEGGTVRGHDEVREYWTRQWAHIEPTVVPTGFTRESDGRLAVTVQARQGGRGHHGRPGHAPISLPRRPRDGHGDPPVRKRVSSCGLDGGSVPRSPRSRKGQSDQSGRPSEQRRNDSRPAQRTRS
ncbi:nuclear transport factor 2 family protein [Planotetraspora silvatica]|uniref:nuclear transport factor 2 family protein n=1 Tax=Planotetraspora silvatica TaxID=234614 RepID=UPI0035716220